RDVQALKNSRILLMLIDGRVPDEGACVELGMAYAYNKICIGFQTDIRKFSGMQNNLMIDYSFTYNIAHTWDELREILLKIKNLK
ncbi:nucleoside 2-deoxyribosyltransferase, partial [Acidiplasma aeolicum]|uniref:nucleoside 2-deoxyribosyltransferase n=2 Tax=Acidiplasma TaxID=507753 RepID=UPI000B0D9C2F